MFNLFDKYSKKWVYVLVTIFTLTFFSLMIVRYILNTNIAFENIIAFALLSLIVAFIITIGGYLGGKTYFWITLFFNIMGIIYMLYVSINKTSEGWSDLVSIISYMFSVGIGVILGIVVQVIVVVIPKKI